MRAKDIRTKYHYYRLRFGGGLLSIYHLPFADSSTTGVATLTKRVYR